MRPPRVHRRSVLASAGRIVGAVLLGAVAILALLVGGTLALVQSRWGSEAIRRFALEKINAEIAGRLAVDRLGFAGWRLTLSGIDLRDPAGRPALAVDRLDVTIAPRALLRGRIETTRVAIQRPRVFLVPERDGLGIARAFAPKVAAPPPESKAPARRRWVVEARGLELTDGAVEYRSGEGGRRVRIDELAAQGTLRVGRAFELAAAITRPGLRLTGHWTIDLETASAHSRLEASLRASLPGSDVKVDATVATGWIDVAATIDATDLAATARAAAPFVDGSLDLAGSAHLEAVISGPPGAPALRLKATAPTIRVAELRGQGLAIRAVVPDLRAPTAFDAEIAATSARLGMRHFHAAALSIRAAGAGIAVHARAKLPAPVELTLTGRRDHNASTALTLDRLNLAYPGARWSLARPARVELAPDRQALADFILASGAERLRLDFTRGSRGFGGRVEVTALELATLAPLLAPAGPPVGGRLDADVRFAWGEVGPASTEPIAGAPTLDARVVLAGGSVGRVHDLAIEMEAHASRGRVHGRLAARAVGVSAEARFDLPARWPLGRPGRTPVDLEVRIADSDLARALPAIATATASRQPLPPVTGHLGLHAHLTGTTAAPTLELESKGRAIAIAGRTVGDVALAVRAKGNGPVDVDLDASGVGGARDGRAHVTLRAPLSLRDALDGELTLSHLARLERSELTGRAVLDKVPVAAVSQFLPSFRATGGTLSSRIDLGGTARDPKGAADITLTGVAADAFPATDGQIQVELQRNRIAASVRVTRRGRPMLEGHGHVETGWRGLIDSSRLMTAPIDLRATLGPLPLLRRGLPSGRQGTDTGTLKTNARADLTLLGTLGVPRLTMVAEARDVRLDEGAVGAGHLEATYAEGRARVEARLDSANGGTLRAHLEAEADLAASVLGRGIPLDQVPFDLRAEIDRLDLRALSGIVPEVRQVSGTITGSAAGHGTAAAPQVAGRLDWKDGGLTLSGYGDYREVHLAIHGNERVIDLDELSAKSGDGKARLTGRAERVADGFQVSAQSNVSRFLLYKEGQPLVRLSLDAALAGKIAARTELTATVKDANVELVDGHRRDLQPLDLPRDVVLVEDGKPQGRDQDEKLRALSSRLSGAPPPSKYRGDAPNPHARFVLFVETARRIWVSGKDAKLELAVEPGMRIAVGARARIYGTIAVRRGRVDVFGRRFDLHADSTVRWNGRPDKPEVDVEAQYDNSNENVSVVVTVRGSPGALDVQVQSPNRSDLTSSQLYTLVISGHLDDGSGRSSGEGFSATSEAASVVGGLVATGLQATLARRLPLDVFTIDAAGGTSLAGTQVEAGRYVTDRLYVGYVGRIGADPSRYQNRNAVHAEYRLTSRWQIEGEYGDVGTGSADAVWRKNY